MDTGSARRKEVEKVHTYENGADMLIKTMSKDKHGTRRRLADMYITSGATVIRSPSLR